MQHIGRQLRWASHMKLYEASVREGRLGLYSNLLGSCACCHSSTAVTAQCPGAGVHCPERDMTCVLGRLRLSRRLPARATTSILLTVAADIAAKMRGHHEPDP